MFLHIIAFLLRFVIIRKRYPDMIRGIKLKYKENSLLTISSGGSL